jgi:hypothetical protein
MEIILPGLIWGGLGRITKEFSEGKSVLAKNRTDYLSCNGSYKRYSLVLLVPSFTLKEG